MGIKVIIGTLIIVIFTAACMSNKTKQMPLSSIDTIMQDKTKACLVEKLTKYRAISGKVIIMETATGYNQSNGRTGTERYPLPIPAYNRFLYPISNGTEAGSYPFGCIGNW